MLLLIGLPKVSGKFRSQEFLLETVSSLHAPRKTCHEMQVFLSEAKSLINQCFQHSVLSGI